MDYHFELTVLRIQQLKTNCKRKMHSFFDKKTVAGSHRFLTELLLELYVVSDGAFAARTVRQALQHGADLPLGGFDLGMERTRRSRRSS